MSRTRKVKRRPFSSDACLDVLDRPAWGPAPKDSTGLIQRCHELRTKPLNQFTVNDLITMIGQRIGVEYLMPIALDVLKENQWATTDLYVDGVLLATVLRTKPEFWMVNHDWAYELHDVVRELGPLPTDCDHNLRRLIDAFADTFAIIEKQLRRGPVA